MTGEADIKTLLTIGENVVIEFKRAGKGPEHDTYETIWEDAAEAVFCKHADV